MTSKLIAIDPDEYAKAKLCTAIGKLATRRFIYTPLKAYEELAVEETSPSDLVLVDMYDPPRALRFIERITEATPGIFIMAIGVSPGSNLKIQCQDAGAVDIVSKPYGRMLVRNVANEIYTAYFRHGEKA